MNSGVGTSEKKEERFQYVEDKRLNCLFPT